MTRAANRIPKEHSQFLYGSWHALPLQIAPFLIPNLMTLQAFSTTIAWAAGLNVQHIPQTCAQAMIYKGWAPWEAVSPNVMTAYPPYFGLSITLKSWSLRKTYLDVLCTRKDLVCQGGQYVSICCSVLPLTLGQRPLAPITHLHATGLKTGGSNLCRGMPIIRDIYSSSLAWIECLSGIFSPLTSDGSMVLLWLLHEKPGCRAGTPNKRQIAGNGLDLQAFKSYQTKPIEILRVSRSFSPKPQMHQLQEA